MNPQLAFVLNRQFWSGVAATIVVVFLLAMSLPNYFLRRGGMALYDTQDEAREVGYQSGMEEAQQAGYTGKLTAASLSVVKRAEDRKTVRTGSMDMVVKSPKESSGKIRDLAEQAGGFLVNSEVYGGNDAASASLTVRVPAEKFQQVSAQIRQLGVRVESEKVNAQDVTKEYVDQSARLRNLHAQELQYLGILKQARTVKDTIAVSDKLNEVRGEIEQQQAEFDALSKQVETVALNITLRAEADARVFGLNWRPLYQLKLAARQGLNGIGDYASTMGAFIFYLPTVLLWLATILIGAAISWRVLLWAGRMLFLRGRKPAQA